MPKKEIIKATVFLYYDIIDFEPDEQAQNAGDSETQWGVYYTDDFTPRNYIGLFRNEEDCDHFMDYYYA